MGRRPAARQRHPREPRVVVASGTDRVRRRNPARGVHQRSYAHPRWTRLPVLARPARRRRAAPRSGRLFYTGLKGVIDGFRVDTDGLLWLSDDDSIAVTDPEGTVL